MRRFAAVTAILFGALAFFLAVLLTFGPRETLNLTPRFDEAALPADLDTYLAAQEAEVGGILPGAEKRIVWAGAAGAKTDLAVVYLHGFSATAEEIRPVPDLVAKALGANLYYARLAGHGLGSERFAGPKVQDWINDTAEALAIGRRIGGRVVVIATSTGGTLAAEAALQPAMMRDMAGIAFVSPNFGIQAQASVILTWPGARWWAPVIAGRERCFEPVNERHAQFWTTCYPTVALLPMAALAEHAGAADYAGATVPALFLFAEADQVVSPDATKAVAARWGGKVTLSPQVVGAGDDPYSHVIAGEVLSPSMTEPVAEAITGWVRGL
ncbi:alpha/beta fold hydrolase [Frigidibacter sp. RF13]|uniref:alpha/beta hydrolase n=1 Tax=Frigidibacter sp. RF13 TaxID=2997340 RepID=UPI00226F4A93|nr:alpha/beta fold hydrolase [Frigidibacter sp. RF13]MCY1127779.1 alpha/beta fold hydrolase [Frigidibacter sp. RF13]